MEKPIAKARREAIHSPYNADPLINRIKELLQKKNESYREASLRAGLDHQAIRRIFAGKQPQMHICILLADHFRINPNEFLQLAGWPVLKAFSVNSLSDEKLPIESIEVARSVARITDPGTRKEVAEAVLTLLRKYVD
jgi:hypothetical protein